ncbi:MAG: biotin transporter BioY [Lachnospiraceae bacterium]|nr:biotin transporter BioY [Lachnospiraceae bacterium]
MGDNNTAVIKPGVRRDRSKTLDLVYTAIGVTLIAVCSWITIPMTVPFTLQTFAVFAVLLILGGKRGTLATLVYVLMGAVGIPVFSGFGGGVGILFGKTGGYILGFVLAGLVYWAMTAALGDKLAVRIAALAAGLIVCYAFGTAWFMYLYMKNTGPVGLMTVLSWCVFPFIVPDIVKLGMAVLVSRRIKPLLDRHE